MTGSTARRQLTTAPWRSGAWLCSTVLITLFTLGTIGCSSGGGDAVSDAAEVFDTQGISLPSEVSAVSSKSDGESPSSVMSLLNPQLYRLMAVDDLAAESDYNTVPVRKFVEIKALEVFDILSEVFDGVRQTHYEDHVGDGWYKAMVAFKDSGGDGSNQTNMQEWYVRSRMFDDDGTMRNNVQLKIVENDGPGGQPQVIRVETDITDAPTTNDDGSLADMGTWEIRALFGESGDGHFHATASVLESGASRVTLEETFVEDMEGQEMTVGTRALIIRS